MTPLEQLRADRLAKLARTQMTPRLMGRAAAHAPSVMPAAAPFLRGTVAAEPGGISTWDHAQEQLARTVLALNQVRAELTDNVAAALGYSETPDVDPTPPADVLAREITPADVARYPAYFVTGAGRARAESTDCGHGYWLTDSCPGCDADGARTEETENR